MPPLATEPAPAVPEEPPPVGVLLFAFCKGDEVADTDGVLEPAGVGLAEVGAGVPGVAFALGGAVELPQSVPVGLAFGVLLTAGAEIAVVVVVALAVVVLLDVVAAGLLVAVPLAVPLALPVGLVGELGGEVDGLVGELGGEVDGLVGGWDGVLVGLGEPGVGAGEGDADDGGHDASGVGSFPAGLVATAPVGPVPLPRAVPPLPGAAELAALAAW